MSLTEQAVQAITDYRKAILIKPTEIEKENLRLLSTCKALARQDQNVFYTVNKNSFGSGDWGFPSSERFDREEYMTFRYLYESSYYVRRIMYKNQKLNLDKLIADVEHAHPELSKQYEHEYGFLARDGFSKRASLKIEAVSKGLGSSKNLFIFQKVLHAPKRYGQDTLKWIYPNNFRSDLYAAFKESSKEIAKSWGANANLLDFYINHIDAKKLGEKIAIISGVSAGTVLAAWGVSQLFNSNNSFQSASSNNAVLPAATTQMASMLASNNIPAQQNYGLENFPEYFAPQSNRLMANQAGFLNCLQPSTGTNQYDLQIAHLDLMKSVFSSQPNYLVDSTPIPSSTLQPVLPSLGLGSNHGNILGCKAVLSELTSPDGAMTQVYGTINGQNVFKTFRKIGNTLYIN